jgi:hypothetical protein
MRGSRNGRKQEKKPAQIIQTAILGLASRSSWNNARKKTNGKTAP